jgi:precorrin-2 dehydrogenase/sirohydrochlorin ferrochelatase
MAYEPRYPIFLDLVDKPVLVVGAGAVAERKVRALLPYGARVAVVAPEATAGIRALAADASVLVSWQQRAFEPEDCQGVRLVFCATSSEEVNRAVYAAAQACGAWANVVDVPPLCDFYVPSLVSRGPLQVAVSTSGASPTVAKQVRRDLEQRYDESWSAYLELLGEVRALVLADASIAASQRRPLFEQIAAAGLRERIKAGERPSAAAVVAAAREALR